MRIEWATDGVIFLTTEGTPPSIGAEIYITDFRMDTGPGLRTKYEVVRVDYSIFRGKVLISAARNYAGIEDNGLHSSDEIFTRIFQAVEELSGGVANTISEDKLHIEYAKYVAQVGLKAVER